MQALDPRALCGLLGTGNLVMVYGQVAFDQELLVIRMEDCLVDVLAGKGLNRGLLDHLATLTRNQVRFAGAPATVPMLTEPTSAQRDAFELLGVTIPLTLK